MRVRRWCITLNRRRLRRPKNLLNIVGNVVHQLAPSFNEIDKNDMTYARKVDANQAEIVQAFRKLGFGVLDLSGVGQGCPDLLVLRKGRKGMPGALMLVEVKDGKKPPSARQLTPPQVEFHAHWPVSRVMSVDDVYALVGL